MPARRERKDGAAGGGASAAHQPRQSRLGPPGGLLLPFPHCCLPPPRSARAKWPWRRHARAGVSARAKMAYIQVRAGAGGEVPGEAGGTRPLPPRARKGRGRPARLPQTCLEEKGAKRRHCAAAAVRPGRTRQGDPQTQAGGPEWALHACPLLPGRGWGWGGLLSPLPPPLCTPPEGRGRGKGRAAGVRQAPGPPAAVAVVTAPANWPVERAGGSCSGQDGQGRRFSRAQGAEGWGIPTGQERTEWQSRLL